MNKTYLLKYETPAFLTLSDYVEYQLHVEKVWFWGLFKTKEIIPYKVYDRQDSKAFYKYWDKLIKEKKPLDLD
jgi:hypothetical protein